MDSIGTILYWTLGIILYGSVVLFVLAMFADAFDLQWDRGWGRWYLRIPMFAGIILLMIFVADGCQNSHNYPHPGWDDGHHGHDFGP